MKPHGFVSKMNVRKTRFTNKRLITSWVTINLIRRQWWIFMHFKPFFLSPKRIPIEENDQQNNNNNNKNSSFFPSFWQQKENKGKLQFLIVSFRFDCFLLFILIVFFFVVVVFSCSNFNCFGRLREWSPLPLLAATAEKHRERKRERQTERERALHVVDFHTPNKLWETVAAKTTITNRQL